LPTTSSGFTFGTSTTQSPPTTSSDFTFSTPTTRSPPTTSSGFTFSTPTTQSPSTTSSGFTFSTPTAQSPPLFGFGSGFQSPPPTMLSRLVYKKPTIQSRPLFGFGSGFQSSPTTHPTSAYSFPPEPIIPTPLLLGSSISTTITATNSILLPLNNQSSTTFVSFGSIPSSTSVCTSVTAAAPAPSIFGSMSPSTSSFGAIQLFGGFKAPNPSPSAIRQKK
jgi:nuclear pore complex protein Nup62